MVQNSYRFVSDTSEAQYANHFGDECWKRFFSLMKKNWKHTSIIRGDFWQEGLPAVKIGMRNPDLSCVSNALQEIIKSVFGYHLGTDSLTKEDYDCSWLDTYDYECNVESYKCYFAFKDQYKQSQRLGIATLHLEINDFEVAVQVTINYNIFAQLGVVNIVGVEIDDDGLNYKGKQSATPIIYKYFSTLLSVIYKLISAFTKKYDGYATLEEVVLIPKFAQKACYITPYNEVCFGVLGSMKDSYISKCIKDGVPAVRLVVCSE